VIGVIVAAHGSLASSLLSAAQLAVKNIGTVEAIGIEVDEDGAHYEARLREAVARVQGEGGTLVLTDMFGGTPSNVGLTLHDHGKVEVLTGANLPMLIKTIQLSVRDVELTALARQVKEYGQRAIAVASEVLTASAAASTVATGTPSREKANR